MRTFPRVLAVVASLALVTAACGGDEPAAEPAVEPEAAPAEEGEGAADVPTRSDAELVIWTDELKVDAVREIADSFAETNGITVDVQVISGDAQASFITANNAGNGPDVMVGAHDWIGNMVQNGAIEPLQLSADQLENYSDVAVSATTYNDQLYGLPYGIEALALYRNTDVVPEAPQTLDAAIAAGQQAVEAGEVEVAFALPVGELGDAYHMQPLLTSAGGYLFGETPEGDPDPNDLGLDTEGGLAAAQKISELGQAGVLSQSVSTDNNIALFAEGRAAFLVSGPWALNDLNAAGVNYEITPIPGFEGGEPAQPFAGVQAFFVASQGENKLFAQEFVANAVNSEEGMTAMFEGSRLPSAMTSVREAAAPENPELEIFAEAAEAANPMPAIPAMAAVWEPLGRAYAAIVGGADPVPTMTDTAETIRSAIGS